MLRLFHDRYIWKTILAMLEANPSVARGSFGEHWLGWCYTTTQLVSIRRECDHDKNSAGIGRSLGHLAGNPRIATRAWFEQQIRQCAWQDWEPWELAHVDARFDEFAVPGEPFIDAALVRRDIAELAALIGKVNTYTQTDSDLAHTSLARGRAGASDPVTSPYDQHKQCYAVGLFRRGSTHRVSRLQVDEDLCLRFA